MAGRLRRDELLLRACEADDIDAVTAIYRHEVLNGCATFEIDPPDRDEMSRRREALVTGGYPYLVAQVGRLVAGYAYAGPYRARLAYRSTVENSVYVADPFRRSGVALALLQALIDETAARGFRQMIAVIGDSANDASGGVARLVA